MFQFDSIFIEIGLKIWVKFRENQAKINLEGCEDVFDLIQKVRSEPQLRIPKEQAIVLTWKNEELQPRTKISSLNLSEAIDPKDDTFFLIIQIATK